MKKSDLWKCNHCDKKKITGLITGTAIIAAASELLLSLYFVKRTLVRSKARVEDTMKMAGTDWSVYVSGIREDREWLWQHEHESVTILSRDGLKLSGTMFPVENSRGTVLCLHGYTSNAEQDYTSLARYYMENNFQILLVDHRAHGQSEGTYIGFGILDRYDALKWIEYLNHRFGIEKKILVQGTSMGAATALMLSGLKLPKNVAGIVSDCAFTSPWDVFKSVLKNWYHLPAFPLLHITNWMAKRLAGYDYRSCTAKEEVKKSSVPILLIHGEKDTFVPTSMCEEIYRNCPDAEMQIIAGASHAESFYKDTALYKKRLQEFFVKCEI